MSQETRIVPEEVRDYSEGDARRDSYKIGDIITVDLVQQGLDDDGEPEWESGPVGEARVKVVGFGRLNTEANPPYRYVLVERV